MGAIDLRHAQTVDTPKAGGTEEGNVTMVTMNDVAKAAGVSRATASYALRGDPRIIPETTERVLEAARRLHYTTNLSARLLRSGRNGVIGVAIFELDYPYPSEMSAAVSREVARHGMQAIVQQTANSKEGEVTVLRKVTSQLCDGMIFSPGNVNDEEIRALSGGKPMVLLDDISPDPAFDSVYTACEQGSAAAVRHLLDIGCRNILVVGASYEALADDRASTGVGPRRLLGSLDALEEASYPIDPGMFIPLTSWNSKAARRCAHGIVDSGRPVDGIFCMTDMLAIGMVRGLADRGVRVPDDVAVIGFDGIAEGEYYIPSLTTVRTDLDDLARKAVGLLLRRIGGGSNATPTRLTADYELVMRESTRR